MLILQLEPMPRVQAELSAVVGLAEDAIKLRE